MTAKRDREQFYTYNGNVEIIGVTTGKMNVEVLGVKLFLQRWTGSEWITIYSSPDYVDNNTRTIWVADSRQINTGFYYRVITLHWAQHGNVIEDGEMVGDSILIN